MLFYRTSPISTLKKHPLILTSGVPMLDLTKIPDAVRSEGSVSRRLVLAYGAALAGLPLVSSRLTAADRKIVFESNPFTLGVASGDPDANSLVLWTKLAPDPTTAQGGMNPEMVPKDRIFCYEIVDAQLLLTRSESCHHPEE